jgi:hypothetical protein
LELERVYVELLGFVVADPVTFLSDVSMAGLAFWLGFRLKRQFNDRHSYWASLFFLFLGLSTLMGGTSHLLDYYFGKGPHLAAWITNCIAVALAQIGAMVLIANERIRSIILALLFVQFIVIVSLIFTTQQFVWVKINSAIGLVAVVTSIHFINFSKMKDKVFLALPLAIISMVIPAITHAMNLQINELINRNVISHVLLLPCFYALYVAYCKLGSFITTRDKDARLN